MVDLDELRRLVGSANVLTDVDAAPALEDWRGAYQGAALAVVRPGDTEEVAAVMRWCAEHDVVVVPQGGNTGLSGGATPRGERACVVLSMQRMRAVETVDAAGWTLTAQSGATIESMQDAAAAVDRLFAPDWGARGSATIGGAIATDAGGNNVVRYGNTRDQILGLEVVLADGRIWDGLRALRKDSTGYDLAQLFVGSEGTLGVVTRAVVKLHPAPRHQQSAMAALTGLDRLMDVFALARSTAPDALTAFELVPEVGVAKVCDTFGITHPTAERAPFYVLARFAAPAPVADLLAGFLAEASDAGMISDAVVAATPEHEARLWTIRDELPPMGLYEHHAKGLKLDTAVPIARIGEYHDGVQAIVADLVPDAVAYGFGHVGDGNLHMTILPLAEEDVAAFSERKPELVRRIDELTFAMGGTISAEHGIGQELRGRVADQKPAIEWELMRSIKAVLDPDDRLNPGVMLPDP